MGESHRVGNGVKCKRESLTELEMEWSVKGRVSQSWKWSGVFKWESLTELEMEWSV